MPDRRLLIGFTPTPAGDDAVELGRLLAKVTGATPVVASVLPWPNYLIDESDGGGAFARSTKGAFAEIGERFGDQETPIFEAVADHSAADALQRLAGEHRAEMIVIGSAHRGPLGRTLAGSTGNALLHGSPCSVAVAPRGYAERGVGSLRKVAVAFDGSPESWAALNAAITIATSIDGQITVLVVSEPPQYGYSEALAVLSAEELESAELANARQMVELALGRIPPEIPSDHRLLVGGPGRALAEVSADFDLLVCGSRGWGPLRRVIVGSTAASVIARAGCPVLVTARGASLDRPGRDGLDRAAATRARSRGGTGSPVTHGVGGSECRS
jgi:nucleotide-binding universal stress UspA family protein